MNGLSIYWPAGLLCGKPKNWGDICLARQDTTRIILAYIHQLTKSTRKPLTELGLIFRGQAQYGILGVADQIQQWQQQLPILAEKFRDFSPVQIACDLIKLPFAWLLLS